MVRRESRRQPFSLVVVDYLQLMSCRADSREQEISRISRALKALAKELNVPVIALSQLNREIERRTLRRPQLSDLRESGAIEQDADVVMFIYHPKDDDPGNPEVQQVAEVIVAKQRNGPQGSVLLHWDEKATRFAPLARHNELGLSA